MFYTLRNGLLSLAIVVLFLSTSIGVAKASNTSDCILRGIRSMQAQGSRIKTINEMTPGGRKMLEETCTKYPNFYGDGRTDPFVAPPRQSTPITPENSTYTLLAPLTPDTSGQQTVSTSEFSGYLQQLINIAIGLTGAISVLMLIIGGFEYIFSSANEALKKDAKDKITNAILGLLIALSGYLILSTINPALLTLGLPHLGGITTPTPTGN